MAGVTGRWLSPGSGRPAAGVDFAVLTAPATAAAVSDTGRVTLWSGYGVCDAPTRVRIVPGGDPPSGGRGQRSVCVTAVGRRTGAG